MIDEARTETRTLLESLEDLSKYGYRTRYHISRRKIANMP